jgi:hypothetical protein
MTMMSKASKDRGVQLTIDKGIEQAIVGALAKAPGSSPMGEEKALEHVEEMHETFKWNTESF